MLLGNGWSGICRNTIDEDFVRRRKNKIRRRMFCFCGGVCVRLLAYLSAKSDLAMPISSPLSSAKPLKRPMQE